MSTAKKARYYLAAAAAVTSVSLMVSSHVLSGIVCFVGAVLLLPILYEWLQIESNEIQFLSPTILLAVSLLAYMILESIPAPFRAPLKTVYTEPTSVTTTVQATTTTQHSFATKTVYRSPSGSRYHLDADCCGVNAYEVTLDQAETAGLTPCKKCAS